MGVVLPPFQQLVDGHWRDVARLCMALAGPDAGEDAAQRAWMQALEAYSTLEHASNLKGWLMTIARRAAIDEHRARARRPIPVEEVPDRPSGSQADGLEEGVWGLVRELPERRRTALVLRYVLDLTHEEAAEILGTTPPASRRLVSDALATLRGAMQEEVSP